MSNMCVPPSYLARLLDDLGTIEPEFLDVSSRSTVVRSTLNDGGGGVMFVGFPEHYWGPSPADLERDRTGTSPPG